MTKKQKNSHIVYVYDLTPYPRKLWVVIGEDYEFIKSKFTWMEQGDDFVGFPPKDLWSNGASGCTFGKIMEKSTLDYGILVWIIGKPTGSIIAHESFHVTSTLFEEAGVEYDAENQEVFAYQIGQVYDYINNAIMKNKKNI